MIMHISQTHFKKKDTPPYTKFIVYKNLKLVFKWALEEWSSIRKFALQNLQNIWTFKTKANTEI